MKAIRFLFTGFLAITRMLPHEIVVAVACVVGDAWGSGQPIVYLGRILPLYSISMLFFSSCPNGVVNDFLILIL